jgi:membrane-associated phospholipid phosphatase
MNYISSIIYNVGQNGPEILLYLTIYLLWNKKIMAFYYFVGYFLNSMLNLTLKGIFQQPRPSEDIQKFNVALKNGGKFLFNNGIPFKIFGMPSGHAESCLYSTMFLFLVLHRIDILFIYLFFSVITIYQRIEYKFHTLFQTIVGSIVGVLFGYTIFYLTTQNLKGKHQMKPDDNAVILCNL